MGKWLVSEDNRSGGGGGWGGVASAYGSRALSFRFLFACLFLFSLSFKKSKRGLESASLVGNYTSHLK